MRLNNSCPPKGRDKCCFSSRANERLRNNINKGFSLLLKRLVSLWASFKIFKKTWVVNHMVINSLTAAISCELNSVLQALASQVLLLLFSVKTSIPVKSVMSAQRPKEFWDLLKIAVYNNNNYYYRCCCCCFNFPFYDNFFFFTFILSKHLRCCCVENKKKLFYWLFVFIITIFIINDNN